MPLIEQRTAVTANGLRLAVEVHDSGDGVIHGIVHHPGGATGNYGPHQYGAPGSIDDACAAASSRELAIRRTWCAIEDGIDGRYGPSTWE